MSPYKMTPRELYSRANDAIRDAMRLDREHQGPLAAVRRQDAAALRAMARERARMT